MYGSSSATLVPVILHKAGNFSWDH